MTMYRCEVRNAKHSFANTDGYKYCSIPVACQRWNKKYYREENESEGTKQYMEAGKECDPIGDQTKTIAYCKHTGQFLVVDIDWKE